ncbi:hypothetical protein AXG93_2931s1130 [Marchantia polymorpha subsp. ruderalis]|uniref:Uncharacterized protein n=2 Tax=Marchantia polymorpha TaxID=3197 RepID=A0A176VWZ8_MARPO|nr:hypothetical protein AXG93_2931s1130 [Marchantia polymorpha subsp. ruderalis]
MSISAIQPNEGMETAPDKVEKTWLEVVKAAVSLGDHDIVSRDSLHYPKIVEQSWIHTIKDPKDFKKIKKNDFVGDVLQKIEEGLEEDQAASKFFYEERELVRDLQQKLEAKGALTEEIFLGLLKPHLESLKSRTVGGESEGNVVDGPHSNGSVSPVDRRSTLSLVRAVAVRLGPRLISTLLQCCALLRLWSMVHILLERRVVDTRDCSRIVESAIEDQQARTLCHCITYGPDLAPQDFLSILVFFLRSMERTPKSFQVVKGEWKRLALSKIQVYKNRKEVASESGEPPSPATVLALANAIDGFSAPELCIHQLVASDQDESVLTSVVAKLEPPQLLSLLQYLCKWVERYSSQLARYPTPKLGRVPSMNQVLFWTSVILECNYTKFVLSSDYHAVVKAMRKLVQPLVELSTHLTPLIGIVDHLRYRRYAAAIKTRVHVPTAPTDYVIELLDLS